MSTRSGTREERRLLEVQQHRHDDPIEQPRAALDDVHVTVGQRIERARIDGDDLAAHEIPRSMVILPARRTQGRCRPPHAPAQAQPGVRFRRGVAFRVFDDESRAARYDKPPAASSALASGLLA